MDLKQEVEDVEKRKEEVETERKLNFHVDSLKRFLCLGFRISSLGFGYSSANW